MKNKRGSLLIAAGLLLMAAALCLSLYNLREDRQAKESVEAAAVKIGQLLETEPASDTQEAAQPGTRQEIPDYILDPGREMPVQNIYGYDYIGMLEIPVLDLLLPVMADWDYTRLQTAPCRYTGTPYLGNFVIAAHNYPSHFGNLYTLSVGDEITFTDMDRNVFTYRVVTIESLQPTAVEEMTAGEYDLSLFTCTTGGNLRVTVRCDQVEE